MAKPGLDIKTILPVLRDANSKNGWSICIGAGTSKPLLPDWYSLVEKLINNNCDKEEIIDIEKYKKLGFTPDAMIQAVKNHFKFSDETFLKLLSEEVFLPIKSKLNNEEWETFIKVHEGNNMSLITKKEWKIFEQVITKCFYSTTSNFIAKVIIDSIENDIAPKSVLTFNGEAILLSLLNYYFYIKTNSQKLKFDRVVNSISMRDKNRIPYIHCHGVIPINDVPIKTGKKASDKLVFSEESYLQLANNAFSWQSNSFIDNCINSKMVFIGVSLTDSNMRRWLSWIHANKIKELALNEIEYTDATEHFWICVKPESKQEKLWIEESVAHLGVRLVWIDNWNQTGKVLTKMLGI